MRPPREGIILNSSEQWDELKHDCDPEWGPPHGELKPAWKASPQVPRHRQLLRRLTTSLAGFFRPLPGPDKLRPTAYLDGLRGFAALLVYVHHHQLWAHGSAGLNDVYELGFGYEGRYSWVALPFIRHFFTGGHFSVAVFFVISGYVLSVKPLSLIHAREHVRLGDAVASALFRRWLRLYIPIIVVTLAFAMSWHVTGMWVNAVTPAGNWRDELWDYYCEFKNFSFVFREGGVPWFSYHFHLWSLPVEFRGSMVVYAAQLALSRCSQRARLLCQVALIWYFMFVADGWYGAMFMSGMLICDLELLAKRGELPSLLARFEPVKGPIFAHLFIIALYLGGVPQKSRDVSELARNRGWYYLSWFKPQAVFDYKWFYLWIAATCLVASIPHMAWIKRFFETRLCQFLGRISFALYLVHGPILWTIGDRLYAATGWFADEQSKNIPHWINVLHLPRAGPTGLEVSFLVPQLVLLPLTLLAAEVISRLVDTPAVDFAAWLYRKALGPEPLPVKQAKA